MASGDAAPVSRGELFALVLLLHVVLLVGAWLMSWTGLNTDLTVRALLMSMLLIGIAWVLVQSRLPIRVLRFLRRAFHL